MAAETYTSLPSRTGTCSPKVFLEPQAQLLSCFSSLLDLATTQNASPLDTLPRVYSFPCCFGHCSPWLILPQLCPLPSLPSCKPRPLTHLFVTECSLRFLTLTETQLSPQDRGLKDSLLFLPGPRDQKVGKQQEHSLSFPPLLSAFSLAFAWETLSFFEALVARIPLPPPLTALTNGGHWPQVPMGLLKCAVSVNVSTS